MIDAGMLNFASLVIALIVLAIGLVVWFFANRASSRVNTRIELLEAMLDQQKRQTALLRRLCEENEPQPARRATIQQDDEFVHLVAER